MAPPPAPQRHSTTIQPTTSNTTTSSSRPSVRRNLFQAQLSRRGDPSTTTTTSSSHLSTSHTHNPYSAHSHTQPHIHHRPTTSSTSTSAETLRLDDSNSHSHNNSHNNSRSNSHHSNANSYTTYNSSQEFSGGNNHNSDIVMRDRNGEFEIADGGNAGGFDGGGGESYGIEVGGMDALDEEWREQEQERYRISEAVKHHQRDRNRAPSEPAELLEAVRSSLRHKTQLLADDNWMYEEEGDLGVSVGGR